MGCGLRPLVHPEILNFASNISVCEQRLGEGLA